MYKPLAVCFSSVILLAGMLAPTAMAQLPSEAERQQELLRIWYEIREGVAGGGDVEAKYDVGVANFVARGTAENHERAASWFKRAADRGHAGAHYYLGYMYAVGAGVYADPATSAKHYRDAAKLGHANAQYLIGIRYANGDGVDRDAGEAAKWMSRAAERGIPGAQYYMGQLYDLGQPGMRPDAAKAMGFYRAAAAQGHAAAQNRLGELYLAGRNVSRDLEEAYLWFSLAENAERVEEIRRNMSRGQLAAADARVQAHFAELAQ